MQLIHALYKKGTILICTGLNDDVDKNFSRYSPGSIAVVTEWGLELADTGENVWGNCGTWSPYCLEKVNIEDLL